MSEWAKTLAKYEAMDEMYPDCPCCNGSRYESAVPYESLNDYRPVIEQYPCRLCVTVATIPMEDALEWLRDKVEMEE